jgi:hypothetical protein
MKSSIAILTAFLILGSCKPQTGDTADQHLREENFELKKENDSLKNLIEKSARTFEGDTIQKEPVAVHTSPSPTIAGRHDLTLHWISWERPGSAMITKSGDDTYNIQGSQKGENGVYLKIEGKLKALNDRELEFDGKIEHNVHTNLGEPCVKTGKQLFKATGTRKYWRLQSMLSCDGTTTDYVDIYF